MTSNSSNAVVMYSTEICPFCLAARMLLKKKGVEYQDISVSGDKELRAEMERLSGRRTVPQIFIGEQHVGGFDELYGLDNKGELDAMLGLTPATNNT